ncbi:hypothetical protein ACK0BW_10230 [Acinetobacter baumannii]
MKPEQFIREYGVEKAREVVEGAPESASLVFYYFDEVNDELLGPEYYRDNGSQHFNKENNSWGFCLDPQIIVTEPHDALVSVEDLKRLVESLDRFNKFEDKQEALDAIDDAPEGATDYRKLSCGTRYIKQGPRFFEYWNGSEWCRPTVPFTVETHILRFDKLEDLKQSIKDHESIYGGSHES